MGNTLLACLAIVVLLALAYLAEVIPRQAVRAYKQATRRKVTRLSLLLLAAFGYAVIGLICVAIGLLIVKTGGVTYLFAVVIALDLGYRAYKSDVVKHDA